MLSATAAGMAGYGMGLSKMPAPHTSHRLILGLLAGALPLPALAADAADPVALGLLAALLGLLLAGALVGIARLRTRVRRLEGALEAQAADHEARLAGITEAMEAANQHLLGEIAERRRVELELAQFKQTLDRTLDCVFMFDARTLHFFYFNQGALDQVGYTAEELRTMTPIDIKPEFDRAQFLELVEPLLRGEQSALTFETIHRHRDGHTLPVEIFLQYIEPEGAEPRFVAIVRDITERKKIERMQSEFISTVSHELRTPLTAIRGALSLVTAGTLDDDEQRRREMLEIAFRNSDRLVSLVNDILDMEKLQRGRFSLRTDRLDLGELLLQAVRENRAYGEQFRVHFHYTPPATRVMVDGDEIRLMQVMANLLSNAAKFSPADSTVEVRLRLPGNGRARVEVEDHGRGISEAFRPRVFERFAQDETADDRSAYGTGLGLAIARAIVEAHGGEIGFDSRPGEGTTFHFELPLAPAATAAISR